MSKGHGIWLSAPVVEDYDAATHYLQLVMERPAVLRVVRALKKSAVVAHEAKDLLRAARLPLLEKKNPHVAADLKKIEKGKKLSPVLIVRGDARRNIPLTIADGYHRICASWIWDENLLVACCVTDLPGR